MSGENVSISNGEGEDSGKPVTCPNPNCNQDLMDLDEDFWQCGDTAVHCRRCKRPAVHVSTLTAGGRSTKGIYLFQCFPCKIRFTRKIPGMKRYCPSCKMDIYMFWNLLLNLPDRPSK